MFEDTTNYDFSEDLLQTSFTTSRSNQKDAIKQTDKRIEKRQGSDLEIREHNSKKSKIRSVVSQNKSVVSQNNESSPIKAVPRKFPGPAGLLPDNCDNEINFSDFFQRNKPQRPNSPEFFLCSQKNFSVFENSPWQQMITDYQDSNRELLFETFNIHWIKETFSGKKQQTNYKAPFLACIIESIEHADGKNPAVKIILKDKTGIIQGTILYSLYKQYSNYFIVGSVLVLIQFGVLSAQNNYCLTITPNNLLTIYHVDVESIEDKRCTPTNSEVKKYVLQEYSIEDIWKKYNESHTYFKKQVNLNNISPRFNSNYQNTHSITNVHNSCLGKLYPKTGQRDSSKITVPTTTQNDIRGGTETSPLCFVNNGNNPSSGSATQASVIDKAHSDIWKDLFQEVDPDIFLDDF